MARQTRAQRRARRAEVVRDGGQAERARNSVAGMPRAARAGVPAREAAAERRLPGSGLRGFVAESWGELKKVEWPTQQQLIQGVAVVLIACLIVGTFLYISDQVFKRLVHDILL